MTSLSECFRIMNGKSRIHLIHHRVVCSDQEYDDTSIPYKHCPGYAKIVIPGSRAISLIGSTTEEILDYYTKYVELPENLVATEALLGLNPNPIYLSINTGVSQEIKDAIIVDKIVPVMFTDDVGGINPAIDIYVSIRQDKIRKAANSNKS